MICKISNDNEALIACGDFNTEILFKLIPEIENFVTDIIDGSTTPSVMEGKTYKNGRKLDYILINNKCKKNEVLKVENLSDHYLCIANIIVS